MQFIEAKYEIICMGDEIDPLTLIEKVARVCYKSENQISLGSAPKMIRALIKSQHYAMLEHASYAFKLSPTDYGNFDYILDALIDKGYQLFLRFSADDQGSIISGNVRAWRDLITYICKEELLMPQWLLTFINQNRLDINTLFADLRERVDISIRTIGMMVDSEADENCEISFANLSTEQQYIHYPVTIKFFCDRGISHEIVRHRKASFGQESTRFCNYSRDKFNNDITYIDMCPVLMKDKRIQSLEMLKCSAIVEEWQVACADAERHYLKMIELGCPAEFARNVLNNGTKTELCVTMTISNWRHFFALRACRATGAAHPQMEDLCRPLLEDFKFYLPSHFEDMEAYYERD